MQNHSLFAISPIDGRYADKVTELNQYFSEFALIKTRVLIEIEYFIALCEIPLPQLKTFGKENFGILRNFYLDFDINDGQRVKELERISNHDVKAVEYFIREKFKASGLSEFVEFIHFGLTSQDINNTAVPYLLKDFTQNIYFPQLNRVLTKLSELKKEWAQVPMLARTHGQPASPTKLGKEFLVFIERINKQAGELRALPFAAKFGGATGNFNAHHVAYPEINWAEFADRLVNEILGLSRSKVTTQIEHYDYMAAYFDNVRRINTILIDLCRDIWSYISMEYFRQNVVKNEVGSSAMPHKVNPIDFENAEGNLGISSALCDYFSNKLPVSRLQRDLTDSTVLRNVGVPLSHTVIAFKSILRGLEKLVLNESAMKADLEKNWGVVSEAVQTILRREGYPEPYEALKNLTRTGKPIDKQSMEAFIDQLIIADKVKRELKSITPFNYTGIDF
jgi:adenylosuccinate lyase